MTRHSDGLYINQDIYGCSYLCLFGPELNRKFRLPLPITVGAAGSCDVTICSESMASCAYLLHELDGELALLHVPTNTYHPFEALSNLGIHTLGPLPMNYLNKPLARLIAEIRFAEEKLFKRLPAKARKFTGAALGEYRLAVWITGIILLAFAVWSSVHFQIKGDDHSRVPIELAFSEVHFSAIGASHLRKGYEWGVTFHVTETPDIKSGEKTQLYFEAVGLRHDKELRVYVNDQLIYETTVLPQCVLEFCSHYAAVPEGLLTVGKNAVYIKHRFPESPYFLRNIFLRVTPPLSDSERYRVMRWIEVAETGYENAAIASENLVIARANAEKARDLLISRAETQELLARVDSLLEEIKTTWDRTIKDIWTRTEVALQLERRQLAESHLHHLLRLFPDPSAIDHQKALSLLSQIREQQL